MDGACSMPGESENIKFQSENLKRRGHMEGIRVERRIIIN
jgi:hypothetical protein